MSYNIRIWTVLLLAQIYQPVFAGAFTDPVHVLSETNIDKVTTTFLVSPPGIFSSVEVSWPMCRTIKVIVPLAPNSAGVSLVDHRAGLEALRGAIKSKGAIYFGPAGRGLVPSKKDKCELNSRALMVTERSDKIQAVISFHD